MLSHQNHPSTREHLMNLAAKLTLLNLGFHSAHVSLSMRAGRPANFANQCCVPIKGSASPGRPRIHAPSRSQIRASRTGEVTRGQRLSSASRLGHPGAEAHGSPAQGGNEEALMSVQEDAQEKEAAPKKPAVAIETERGEGGHLGRSPPLPGVRGRRAIFLFPPDVGQSDGELLRKSGSGVADPRAAAASDHHFSPAP